MSHNYQLMGEEEQREEGVDEAEQEEISRWQIFRCVCCPLILLFYSVKIYFCGCIFAKFEDVIRWVQTSCCSCLSIIFCGGMDICAKQWRDKEFGPENSARSLGKSDSGISWMPYEEILGAMGNKETEVLVEGGIVPNDVSQGALGDCWLMSGVSAVAEHPGLIFNTMKTHRYNPRAVYTFSFYNSNPGEGQWETVEVDNLLPTRDGKSTVYAEMQSEGWCVLLEKAMAKWVGSYDALDGGSTAWALTALVGSSTSVIRRESNGQWNRWESKWRGTRSNMRSSNLTRTSKAPVYSDEEFWSVLLDHTERKSVMCCSVNSGSSDRESVRGLAMRHAYSFLRAVELDGHRLVNVRNPWGAAGTRNGQSVGEWQGDWGDASPLWQQYPNIKEALASGDDGLKADGKFWMAFKDFVQYFGSISICPRATGFDDLVLVVDDSQTCGTLVGCCVGCGQFWCCCEGVKALCCAEKRRD